jgi:hypothetical protein
LHLQNVLENAMNNFSNLLPCNLSHYHPSFQNAIQVHFTPFVFPNNFRCQRRPLIMSSWSFYDCWSWKVIASADDKEEIFELLIVNTKVTPWTNQQWQKSTVKCSVKKSKCAGFQLSRLSFLHQICAMCRGWVKGATQLYTSKKECNKLDVTAAQ